MAEPAPRLVLASSSPRRRELLALADLVPDVRPGIVDESARAGEEPEDLVLRLATTKARAVPRGEDEVVLAADTAVVLEGTALGKPASADEAAAVLGALAGREHEVITGVAVRARDDRLATTSVSTSVRMTDLDDAVIARYVATGEPFDKAGGYAIQGRAAAFIEGIEGSWTNVVGLPLVESLALLRAAGLRGP